MIKKLLLFPIFIFTVTATTAQDGTLDLTFGAGGIVTTPVGTGDDAASSVIIQPDGKIVVAGYSTAWMALVRYNANGTLDNTFGTGGIATAMVCSGNNGAAGLALQSDGKIVAAGSCGIYPDIRVTVVRFNTNGTLDNTFDGDGMLSTNPSVNDDRANAVAIQADGKIVIGGNYYNGSNSDYLLIRYNSDGSLDNTFDTDGLVTTAFGPAGDNLRTLIIQPDGKILASGFSYMPAPVYSYNFSVARYNTDGSLDNTFDADGLVSSDIVAGSNDYGESIHLQSDGKIVVGGYSFTGNITAVRYLSNGAPDNAFAANGEFTTSFAGLYPNDYSAALQNDGKILVGGYSTLSGSTSDFALIRLLSNGTLDNTFGTGGMVNTPLLAADDIGTTMILQADGKIVFAGRTHNGTNFDFAMVRYNNTIPTAVTDENILSEVTIYPNPFSAQTTLQGGNPFYNATLTVSNCFGQTVAQVKNISGQTIIFNREILSSGLYFVRLVQDGNTISVDKFVIVDE